MSKAEPLMYSERAERYLRQRGIVYDDHSIAIGKLTPTQRRRALHKERRGWRKVGWTLRADEYSLQAAAGA